MSEQVTVQFRPGVYINSSGEKFIQNSDGSISPHHLCIDLKPSGLSAGDIFICPECGLAWILAGVPPGDCWERIPPYDNCKARSCDCTEGEEAMKEVHKFRFELGQPLVYPEGFVPTIAACDAIKMTHIKYRQCELRCGNLTLVTYLPESQAVVGNKLGLSRELSNDNQRAWEVVKAFSATEDRPAAAQEIRRHRHATGDDLPKQ